MGIKDEDKKEWEQLTIEYRKESGKKDPKFGEYLVIINKKIVNGEPFSNDDALEFRDAKKPDELTAVEEKLAAFALHLNAAQLRAAKDS